MLVAIPEMAGTIPIINKLSFLQSIAKYGRQYAFIKNWYFSGPNPPLLHYYYYINVFPILTLTVWSYFFNNSWFFIGYVVSIFSIVIIVFVGTISVVFIIGICIYLLNERFPAVGAFLTGFMEGLSNNNNRVPAAASPFTAYQRTNNNNAITNTAPATNTVTTVPTPLATSPTETNASTTGVTTSEDDAEVVSSTTHKRKFNARLKFKGAVRTVMTANRLKKLPLAHRASSIAETPLNMGTTAISSALRSSGNQVLTSLSDAMLDDNSFVCKICLDKAPTILLEPCNHLCMCEDCAISYAEHGAKSSAKYLATCPICRSTVTGSRKIFLS